LQKVWRFAAGMGGISLSSIILTQLDKIILSKILTLEMFGYYTLAAGVAMSLYRLTGPVFAATYPRFSQLAALNDQNELKLLYHRSCQLLSVCILPVAAVVALFSTEILMLWTRNLTIATQTHTILSLLIIGTAFNGLSYSPFALQLAHGWTNLSLYISVASAIVLAPSILYMTLQFGAVGAAAVWLILNSINMAITIHFTHRFLLPNEEWRWYKDDFGLPLIAIIIITVIGSFFINITMPPITILARLSIIFIFTITASILAASHTRNWLFTFIFHKNKISLA
jgi:O-antigen/teichoic acid export membrane protein